MWECGNQHALSVGYLHSYLSNHKYFHNWWFINCVSDKGKRSVDLEDVFKLPTF